MMSTASRNRSQALTAGSRLVRVAHRRLRFFVGAVPVQHSTICRVASASAALAARRDAADAVPRAAPSVEFAALGHMLRNGFFFVHGFEAIPHAHPTAGMHLSERADKCRQAAPSIPPPATSQ